MKMKAVDEQKDIGPLLSKISKEPPFSVPDGYFSQFQARLNMALHARENMVQVRKYPYILRPYMAAAVLLIIALLAGSLVFRISKSSRNDRRLERELSQVIEQELYSIPDEVILEIMTSELPDNQLLESTHSDDMINYLLEENLNEEDLLNTIKSTI